MSKIVVALGGNALQDVDSKPTAESQLNIIKKNAIYLVDLIIEGHNLVVTHGNGPQIGRILIQNEIAIEVTPPMPFDICGAMSQGMIGYHLQQVIGDELKKLGNEKSVATIITQVVVEKEDKAFHNPTKPIGPFYSKEEAKKIADENNYVMIEDSGRGYRRVVASPMPKRIVEIETIKTLIQNDIVAITVGGGGIPVIEEGRELKGVAAVIDKDWASERLAEDINADILIMLTAVERVAINFGTPEQKNLNIVSVPEMKQYSQQGYFAPGSMLPKVEAGIRFVESKPGRKTIITSLEKVTESLKGLSGTIIE